ncbi:PREDICTED: protein IQ-DOMAIN 1-like isoform X2 [Ipomoea nil]|uniref:protein IQ-DOMAIN 1-like isoform X2 n=1 Tax=Ipomoea nil TaxID=35883 RepID=UPI0009008E8A|nr:PREDICTED: protein IQ-DOMAIN 1-like isoform X2 [Ipomoea nil]
MGRKGSWFSSVKKAFSPESKEKKANKSKNRLLGKEKLHVPNSATLETSTAASPPHLEEVKLAEVEKEVATAAVAEDAIAEAVQSAAVAKLSGKSKEEDEAAAKVVVQSTAPAKFSGKSKEEAAAIRIQTAFRGYQTRTAFKVSRGLVRLRSLIEEPSVKRQTGNALKCMQMLSRLQSQIHSRRNRMLEESQALQRQLLQKHAKELENLRRGDEWDDSLQSKEKIEASLLSRYEAAMRRERALAYSYSHQQTWKKSSRSPNLLFMDPTNPQWGWSWLERWMGAPGRPLEAHGTPERELKTDHISAKSVNLSISGGEITKSFARHQLNAEQPSSPASQKPTRGARSSMTTKKPKPPSPRVRVTSQDDDARSVFSVQSDRNRRHSIGGSSSVRDDESLASSPSFPSYMASTQSAKAKTRATQSPLAVVENWTPEKGSIGSVKKRLSYPPSQALSRRHSGPPKMDTSIAEPETNGEIN